MSAVRTERREGAVVIVLDRPERSNALSRDTLLALGSIGRELQAEAGLRAVVLTGAGNRAFCAGADLKERAGMDDDAVRNQLALYRSELGWLRRMPVPIVAALNGAALGGGLELALLCDLRVAADHVVLGFPETSLGIIPAAGGTQRLPRIVGEAFAKELILLGRRITAQEALARGLINRITPADQPVLEDTLEWIAPVLEGAPIAQRNALAAMSTSFEVSFEQGLELERTFYEECLRSEDRSEALRAWSEKRKPHFKGR